MLVQDTAANVVMMRTCFTWYREDMDMEDDDVLLYMEDSCPSHLTSEVATACQQVNVIKHCGVKNHTDKWQVADKYQISPLKRDLRASQFEREDAHFDMWLEKPAGRRGPLTHYVPDHSVILQDIITYVESFNADPVRTAKLRANIASEGLVPSDPAAAEPVFTFYNGGAAGERDVACVEAALAAHEAARGTHTDDIDEAALLAEAGVGHLSTVAAAPSPIVAAGTKRRGRGGRPRGSRNKRTPADKSGTATAVTGKRKKRSLAVLVDSDNGSDHDTDTLGKCSYITVQYGYFGMLTSLFWR